MADWSFINDGFIEEKNAVLHFRDLAFQRAYGIFDFLKFINFQAYFIEDHIERFFASANEMRLEIPVSKSGLAEIIQLLIRRNKIDNGGIRLSITGGYSADGY